MIPALILTRTQLVSASLIVLAMPCSITNLTGPTDGQQKQHGTAIMELSAVVLRGD